MVALRPSEIEDFLEAPDPRHPIVLIYGPDQGLVRERADAVAGAAAPADADAFSLVQLEGDVVAADPARLMDEARTLGLFGGKRVVRVRAGARSLVDALKPLFADPPVGALVVIEAGDLRRNAPLRTLCETAPAAVVIACYTDSERDLVRLIERSMREAGIDIEPEARDALVELLGADRRATRSELDKLALYGGESGTISIDDVRAVIADASALALDDAVDAAAAGEADAALVALTKARAAGTAPDRVLGAAIRHVALLHRLSLELDRGGSVTNVVERAQPKIHFRRKPRVERALSRLGAAELEQALVALGQASLSARRQGPLADPIVERALLALARMGKRRGRSAV